MKFTPFRPATYTSTLVPPMVLILVTYLSVMLVYRSIKSFFTFIIFSVKWFAILAALIFIVAYSLGDGNVQQGARAAAQKSGLNMQGNSWADALQSRESLGVERLMGSIAIALLYLKCQRTALKM